VKIPYGKVWQSFVYLDFFLVQSSRRAIFDKKLRVLKQSEVSLTTRSSSE